MDTRKRRLRLRRIATASVAVLVAVCLAGCGFGTFETGTSFTGNGRAPDWARTADAPEPPATIPDSVPAAPPSAASVRPAAANSLFARAAETPAPPQAPVARADDPIGALAIGASVAVAAVDPKPSEIKPSEIKPAEIKPAVPAPPPAAEKVSFEPRGRAYLFRGVAGLIYSRGMDRLNDRINRIGVKSTVNTYLVWRAMVDDAIRDYRRDPQPIIIVGHSMGGDAALSLAETLNAADIPVSLLVTYDPTRMADTVPPNVERYINVFQSTNVMGGGDVVQSGSFHGHYASFNLREHSEIVHINIEKAERIHDQLVTKIAQLAATPAGAEGEAVPLHLVVPGGAGIELWDSGMPVSAHAGDTLQSLAATYHVPAWSLDQLNRMSLHAALSEGQRVIVPRHLVPMTSPANSALSSYAPH